MSRFPVGPPQKSIGETSRDVPAPLLLNLALALNCFVLLVACFLMLFLHPQNAIPFFTPLQGFGIALFGIIGSTATIWSISASRSYSRYLILVNTFGVITLCISFYFGNEMQNHRLMGFLLLAAVCTPTIWVLFGSKNVALYYRVLSGATDVSELPPLKYSGAKFVEKMDGVVTFAAEAFIVVLAILAFVYPFVAER